MLRANRSPTVAPRIATEPIGPEQIRSAFGHQGGMVDSGFRFAVTACLLASWSPAQRGVPVVPAEPLVVLQIDGPAALWQHFLPTEVGEMLASKDAETLRGLLLEPTKAVLAGLGGGTPDAWEAWSEYAGRITLAIAPRPDDPSLGHTTGFVAIEHDGRTDLSTLARVLEERARQHGTEIISVRAGEHEVRVADTLDGVRYSLPFTVDGHEIVVFGDDLVGALRRALSDDAPGFVPDAELLASPIGLHVDLERVVAALRHELAEHVEVPDSNAILTALGFDSLQELRVLARASGPYVSVETSLRFSDHERGMFGGMFPALCEEPRLQRLAPPGVEVWKAVPQRWDVIFGSIFEAGAPFELREMARESWGIDPQRDLLEHLGDEVLILGDVLGVDRAEGTVCFVFEVTDAATVDASLETARAHLDYERDRSIEGVTLWRGRGLFEPEAFARVDQYLVAGWGERCTEWIREIAVRIGGEGGPQADAAPLARLRRHAPPGYNGQSRVPVGTVSTVLLEMFAGTVPDEIAHALERTGDEFRRLLRERGIDAAYALTGSEADRWRARVFW